MSLDKAIMYGKEHRRPYYQRCKIVDPQCRNHGSCEYCRENRMHSTAKRMESMKSRETEE